MSDVTRILGRIERGDRSAVDELLPLVYDELRQLAAVRMATEKADHTLQATALVHEAYLRLVKVDALHRWESREHFFCAAAEAMRRILIDAARARRSLKRGGVRSQVELNDVADTATTTGWSHDLLLDLDEALLRLQTEDPVAAELVKLRLFAGLSVPDAGELLGLSRATAYRNWEFARSWFAVHMASEPP